jgi:hypothetical protein
MIFTKFAEQEKENRSINAEAHASGITGGDLWTSCGGEGAPDVRITSRADTTQIGGASYTITFALKTNVLTEAEIEALTAVGQPSAEERTRRLAADPKMRALPDYYLFGYKFDEIHKPTVMRLTTLPTSPDDLVLVPTSGSVTPTPPAW